MSTLHTINSVIIPFKMLCGKDEGAAENSKNPSKVETKYLPKPRMECQRAESLYTEQQRNTHANPTSVLDYLGFYTYSHFETVTMRIIFCKSPVKNVPFIITLFDFIYHWSQNEIQFRHPPTNTLSSFYKQHVKLATSLGRWPLLVIVAQFSKK